MKALVFGHVRLKEDRQEQDARCELRPAAPHARCAMRQTETVTD